MLRLFVLLLLLANAVYLVWTQGFLAPYGFAPASQAEPERLSQQIRPEAIQLIKVEPTQLAASTPLASASAASSSSSAFVPTLAASAAASAPASALSVPTTVTAATAATVVGASAAASTALASAVARPLVAASSAMSASAASASSAKPVPMASLTPAAETASIPEPQEPLCLQAGLFTEFQANAMRPRLQAALPAGTWLFAGAGKPVRWMVYLGKYASKEVMSKKRVALEQAGIPSEIAVSPWFTPGLSLGSFKTKAQAEAALAKLAERGLRTAKVVQERPELPTQWLRLPAPSPVVQAKAQALVLKISGKRLQSCD